MTEPTAYELAESTPRFSTYFGPWSIQEGALAELEQLAANESLFKAHLADGVARAESGGRLDRARMGDFPRTADGIAVVSVTGVLTKHGGSLADLPFGTVGVRSQLRKARTDGEVRAVLLVIDSPGGMVAGVDDLADEVARLRQSKPVVAYIEDIGASGAYWFASQAGEVIINRTGHAGGIGAVQSVADTSARAAKAGVKVHVIRSGQFKGLGESGAEVTPEELAERQRLVDGVANAFVEAAARGRGMPVDAMRELADGRVHIAAEAVELGLVDRIGTYEEALAAARTAADQLDAGPAPALEKRKTAAAGPAGSIGTTTEEATMAQTETTANAATIDELRSACPGAPAEFLVKQLEAGATELVAARAWSSAQAEKLAAVEAERAAEREAAEATRQKDAARASAPTAPGLTSGVRPAPTSAAAGAGGAESNDAIAEFEAAVDHVVATRGCARNVAFAQVSRSQPKLREAYVNAYNELHPQTAEE